MPAKIYRLAFIRLYYVLILLCCALFCRAQQAVREQINQFIKTANKHTETIGLEKIYLQTDKPAYAIGDTLWFKAYLFDAAYFSASEKSNIIYVELANDSNRLVKRLMLPCYKGLTMGNLFLDSKDLTEGGYTLRAYTNWMRNFGEFCVFKKRFFISQTTLPDWLIRYQPQLTKQAGKTKAVFNINVSELDQTPVRVREMQLSLNEGRRTWFKNTLQTDLDGNLKIDFNIPEQSDSRNLMLVLKDMRKGQENRKWLVPVPINRPEALDLQFMPEGGYLVAGLPAHVAFKAIQEDGLPATVAATVYNSKQQAVASIQTVHDGMGAFSFTPQPGEVYEARIKLSDSTHKKFALPALSTTGTTLQVKNYYQTDSCEVTIDATADVKAGNTSYCLVGLSRGVIFYTAFFTLNNQVKHLKISKRTFPSGVVRFILTTANRTVLNERLAYFDHQDKLNIRLTSNKSWYKQRDSVSLALEVTDRNGAPVQGSFSLAVTDATQVKTDSLSNNSISTYLMLASNLKGHIHNPGYYENPALSLTRWQHTDNLLLCQGWTGYDWQNAFKPAQAFAYENELDYTVKGKVTNLLNKPVANSGITLMSKKPFMITDTITNQLGRFTFTNLLPSDTAVFFLQAKNKKGKSFNVGIEVDEFKPPVFTAPTDRLVPWYVNVDTAKLVTFKKQATLKNNQQLITQGNVLKTVVVEAKKIVKGSRNLNGPGEADVIIDEKELEKSGRTTLGQLLAKRVPGFRLHIDAKGPYVARQYVIYTTLVHLIIDGVELDFFHNPEGPVPRWEFYKEYLDYYDAEEIKGIEVMTSGKYQLKYTSRFLDAREVFFGHSFVEVTTRSGHGPFMKKAIGTYVYRPIPFALPAKFYTPRYTASSIPDMTDIRSTVHWEPNVITNREGKATITFYTADNPGTYTAIAEGTDMNGSVGIARSTLTVKKQVAN
jgi:hypothetical protein